MFALIVLLRQIKEQSELKDVHVALARYHVKHLLLKCLSHIQVLIFINISTTEVLSAQL